MDGIAAMSCSGSETPQNWCRLRRAGTTSSSRRLPMETTPRRCHTGNTHTCRFQWIDLDDIDEGVDSDHLRSTYEIDKRSLGGSKRHAVRDIQYLPPVSPSLTKTLLRLEGLPVDRSRRVAAFYRDLDASLHPFTRSAPS